MLRIVNFRSVDRLSHVFSSRPDRRDTDPGWPIRQASSRFSQFMNQILNQLGLNSSASMLPSALNSTVIAK